ncbi:MAG: N-acetyl-gamma-glutamyl-phosphate reductase [Phenylobacterium sp.]
MAHTVFIDGEAGTTGLQIRERLARRRDLEVLSIDPARRKDADARAELLNAADAVVLCLPDDAAREAVSLVQSNSVRIVDASTAHRVAPGWAYGFAELDKDQRAAISGSTRVANPGCYPTGFIALVRPLVAAGLIPPDFPLTVNAVSGYSGGGKGLIAEFEGPAPAGTRDAFRVYGLNLAHKHLPEMKAHARLDHAPVFAPSVGRFAQGMIVEVPLQLRALPGKPSPADLHVTLQAYYAGERFVEVASGPECAELQKTRAGAGGYVQAMDPESLNGTNRMKLFVFGSTDGSQARLVALLDNLGKGASGAAVQNLNLMLGLEEGAGL